MATTCFQYSSTFDCFQFPEVKASDTEVINKKSEVVQKQSKASRYLSQWFCSIFIFLVLLQTLIVFMIEYQNFLDYRKLHFKQGVLQEHIPQSMKYRELKNTQDPILMKQEYDYFDRKYKISQYTTQLRFCVVSTTYNNNNADRINNYFNSIFKQNYTNYHVVFYDDASTDGTYQAIMDYLEKHPNYKSKIKVIENLHNQHTLASVYDAAYNHCKSEQIIFWVDGDDQVIGLQVMNLFNAVYQKSKAYYVYSNSIDSGLFIHEAQAYHPFVVENNLYRKCVFRAGHLNTFYAQLFRRIDKKDLMDPKTGFFFISGYDAVCGYPMLQMAHRKVQFIPQLTYYYNSGTGLNDYVTKPQLQIYSGETARSFPSYKQISELFQK